MFLFRHLPCQLSLCLAIEFRVLAKFGRNAVVSVHYAYWRIERRRSHDTARSHLGHQHYQDLGTDGSRSAVAIVRDERFVTLFTANTQATNATELNFRKSEHS